MLVMMEANESLAYVAGFFDGEGCLMISRNGFNSSIIAQITNSDERVIHYINALLPGHIYGQKRYGRKKIYRLVWRGEDAIDTIELLLPYLIIKKTMANLVLEYYDQLYSDSPVCIKDLRSDYRIKLSAICKGKDG